MLGLGSDVGAPEVRRTVAPGVGLQPVARLCSRNRCGAGGVTRGRTGDVPELDAPVEGGGREPP